MTVKTNLFCVRPTHGTDTKHFVDGGYVGIAWFPDQDNDGCPYRHRRRVTWAKDRLRRGDVSVPFQNTIFGARRV